MKYIESPGHINHCKHDFQAETIFLENIRLIPVYHKKRLALGISVFMPAQKNFTREPLGPKYKAWKPSFFGGAIFA